MKKTVKGRLRKATGATRMLELGYHQVQVWLNAQEVERFKEQWPGSAMATVLRDLLRDNLGLYVSNHLPKGGV